MAHSGIGYYLNKEYLSSDDLEFSFNFNTSGNYTSFSGDRTFSLTGNTGNFWQNSGSGYFSGTKLIVNSGDFDQDNFTLFLIYNKIKTGQCELLSTKSSGPLFSGFALGIDDANNLNISVYDPVNTVSIINTFDFSLGRNNAICLSKNLNSFTVSKLNLTNGEINSQQKVFPYYCETASDKIYIDSGFVGYIDEFHLIRNNLDEKSIKSLFESFYKTEPILNYSLISEYDTYTYSNLSNVYQPIWEELQSGALDYIRTNIFNKTGIGSIVVTNSGSVINGTGYVSGNLSGIVSLFTGYNEVTTGTRVTGYTTSGQVAIESGIVSYVDIDLYPITVFTSGNIYQVVGKSGITGYTQWSSVFSGPLYETYTTTGFVEETLSTSYSLNFSYVITGLTGNATYLHLASYANNGNDNILINQDLTYTGNNTSFRAIKSTQLNYGNSWTEGTLDTGYINLFSMDGVTFNYPIKTGDFIELFDQNYTGYNYYNQKQNHSLASGFFGYTGILDTDDIFIFINGVYQLSDRLYEKIYVSPGEELWISSGEPLLINSTFSGDYDLSGNFFITDVKYDRNDRDIFDKIEYLNIFKIKKYITGSSEFVSGYSLNTGSSSEASSLFFINGVKLISGVDYSYYSGGYRLITDSFSGVTGNLVGVSPSGLGNINININTGTYSNSITGSLNENSSILFYNRLRQILNIDYIETSSLNLNHNVGYFYEQTLNEIINI